MYAKNYNNDKKIDDNLKNIKLWCEYIKICMF